MDLNLFIVSIVEGLTEFLPISSTAHLILVSKLLSVDLLLPYTKFYLLVIQIGALLAGIFLFSKRIFTERNLLRNILISFIPSAIVGFILYKTFKQLLEGNLLLISLMLFVGGVIFIYLEKYLEISEEKTKTELTTTDAFIVGLAQAVAIVPGVSRSGATIIAGMLLGVKKSVIIEYTFILALPTLGSAVLYDTYKSVELFSEFNNYGSLLFGVLVSFIVAFITLQALKKHLTSISLSAFGIYRVVLALFILSVYIF